ncbi:MAG: molecular chaperone TorD family protein [Nitrososphaeria archaeon]|nr:molecular chaperone TorD family protein [Nitrososphaeria archaeon]
MSEILPGVYLIMRERTYLYRSLVELYRPKLAKPMLENIAQEQFQALGETIENGFDSIKGGHRILCDYVKGKDVDKLIEELGVEYSRLDSKGVFLQRSYDQRSKEELFSNLKRFYQQKSNVIEKGMELDHFINHCNYMFNLLSQNRIAIINRKVNDFYENIRLQREFLKDYIYNWVPIMCQRLYKESESEFYKGLSMLTEGFINVDKEIFDEVIEACREFI